MGLRNDWNARGLAWYARHVRSRTPIRPKERHSIEPKTGAVSMIIETSIKHEPLKTCQPKRNKDNHPRRHAATADSDWPAFALSAIIASALACACLLCISSRSVSGLLTIRSSVNRLRAESGLQFLMTTVSSRRMTEEEDPDKVSIERYDCR